MQHYHTSTNLSRKLDASLRYLQLQLGTPHNLLFLDYAKWGHLAPLSWVKMLWRSLHHFNIHLHMAYPTIAFLEATFLLDITTADGRYLEHFVFAPGGRDKASTFTFPREQQTWRNRNSWFNFWHNFTTTGDKLKVPLGNWIQPTHRIWKWYYRADNNVLQRVKGNSIFHYKLPS